VRFPEPLHLHPSTVSPEVCVTDSLEERQQEQAECDRKEKRVREVLDRLAHLQVRDIPFGGRNPTNHGTLSAWEWKVAIEWALQRIGTVCAVILDQRLRHDRSFVSLAGRLDITPTDAVYMYQVGLICFIEQLDRLNREGIPDDYREQYAAAA
jgi:hypothetical protein